MTDDQVISRLQAYGAQPIDPAVASTQLTAIALAAAPKPRWTRARHRAQVAAALVAGLLLGGSGLAAADALPDTAQEAAHAALKKVGVDVPPGHDRVTEGCDVDENGEHYKNHGQYVKAHPEDPEAAASDCGKPKRSVKDADDATEPEGDEGKGKGKGKANGRAKDKAGDETSTEAGGSESLAPPASTPAPADTHGSTPGKPDDTPVPADAEDRPVPPTTTGNGETHPAGPTAD